MAKDPLEAIRQNRATLVISPVAQLEEQLVGASRQSIEAGSVLMLISFNRSQAVMAKGLEKAGIATKGIHFIDAIAEVPGEEGKEENVLHVQNPSDLTAVQIAIGEFLTAQGEQAIVIVDALATLLIYNEEEAVIRFTRELVEKSVPGRAIVFTQSADPAFMAKISVSFDEVVEVETVDS